MNWLNTLKALLARKAVRGGILVLALSVLAGTLLFIKNAPVEVAAVEQLPLVALTSAQGYAGESTINLIGTVRAFSEAAITSEKAGRVTSVRTTLGATVAAGSIIATLENAAEQASVLQAQGVYEAAIASGAQSGVGVAEAETRLSSAQNTALTATKSAYNTVEGIIFNNIDQFFSDPNSFVPGVRLDAKGYTAQLNSTRIAYQTELPAWKQRSDAITSNSNLDIELQNTSMEVAKALAFVNTFITVLNNQDNNGRYSEADIQGFASTFNGLRNTLIQLQNQINLAETGLETGRDGLAKATLAAAGGTSSAADAQVKQALGSLRAAQANLAKTVIRTPISGTVNALSIRTGDFVGSFDKVAEVANNNALEVVTYAGESDRDVLTVGDKVTIEDKYEGTITEIAPAVDTATGKTEVRVASESDVLQNGDSVRITKQVSESATSKVIIPLSAVKFQISDGAVFVLVDNKLTSRPVTLGTIRGGSVEILDGLTASEQFVADARGLVEGTLVEVLQ